MQWQFRLRKRLRLASSKKSSSANSHARRVCESMIFLCASVIVFVLKGIAGVIPFTNPINEGSGLALNALSLIGYNIKNIYEE